MGAAVLTISVRAGIQAVQTTLPRAAVQALRPRPLRSRPSRRGGPDDPGAGQPAVGDSCAAWAQPATPPWSGHAQASAWLLLGWPGQPAAATSGQPPAAAWRRRARPGRMWAAGRSSRAFWTVREPDPTARKGGRRGHARRASVWCVNRSERLLGLYEKERLGLSQYADDESKEERYWETLDADLRYWTRSLRQVQWYPGHIAKTEKELKEQLRLMDVVIEIRDARIPLSTSHPKMDSWLGNRKRIIVLNREDMISTEDRNAWATYFGNQGTKVVFSNGQLGMGTMKLGRMAKSVASVVNTKRKEKGLLPRPVRAGIVGYPNVGKSSLINRLLKRRMCPAAPRPGVTRELKWVRFGTDLELLDSPGILPMRISDQTSAIKLAICDDIGERSYDFADVAAILVQMLIRHPAVGSEAFRRRYRIDVDSECGKTFVTKLSVHLFNGDTSQAAFRILSDYRKGKFGWVALERPPT